jgi:Uma2 family endonuclease
MSETRVPERQQMAYADYLALPEGVRAEWVDGEVLVTPSPGWEHQQACRRLANLLEAALPSLRVVEAVTVVLPGRERIPDVSVVSGKPEGKRITEVPIITVEVLSPDNRSEDTVRKATEYLAAGVTQYWLADPANRVVDILGNVAGRWETIARLDKERAVVEVPVGSYGSVTVDLGRVFED